MPLPPRLPIELLSLLPTFFDAQRDAKVLKTLSLTSQLFLKPCQTLLFNHIILTSPTPNATIPDGAYPGAKFFNLLERSPKVSRYIQKLTVSNTALAYGWLPNDMALARALKKLDPNQITAFCLRNNRRAQWYFLPFDVRIAFASICRSACLVELSVREVPLTLLGVCGPSLKRFEARDAEARDDGNISSVSRLASEEIVLDSLRLYHHFDLDKHVAYLVDPANKIRLDGLTKLDILAASPEDHACASDLIAHCRDSLRTFVFDPYSEISEPGIEGASVDLTDCTSLTSLELHLDATCPDPEGERHCLHWAASFISKIPPTTSNNIKSLFLSLRLDLSDVPGELTGYTGNQLYYHLRTIAVTVTDSISTNNRKWKALEEVKVDVQSSNPNDDDVEEIEAWVLDAMKPVSDSAVRFDLVALPHYMYGATFADPLATI
ncbi:hypothetical protein D9611_007928 [Ephemerocybe angulata]|uniref:Uncharacterized protein n=1 Tax=Ephemerocybe angulata TaxID=980116 RepID=A0A8H5FKV6_9AGAR|nr:hypothetical protein D9611_007928 [Tulosesus angulatus]